MEENKKYDVGIMGVWIGCNYGSIATYYALNKIISSMGYSVLMIDKPTLELSNGRKDIELSMTHSRRFALEHYNISKSYKLNELEELNKICNMFVIGSDQVWNYGISKYFGKSYYFDYVEDSKKKIAYASSFGHDKDFAPENEIPIISEYMQKFDAISVRESDGVRILHDTYGINGQQVLDPVFLADRSIFDELADKSLHYEVEPYIATYILDPTPEKKKAMLHVSKKLGYKLVNMLDGRSWLYAENSEKLEMASVENLQVEDWILILKNSEFVITDSCHGVSFALIYGKNFISIANKSRGYSRFKSLADLFGFSDRLVIDPEAIINNESLLQPMDYEKVNTIMLKEKERCYKWLKNALETPKGLHKSVAIPSNITTKLNKMLCTGCGACVSACPCDAIILQSDEIGYYRSTVDYNKCIGCEKCIGICPALKLPENKNFVEPELFEFIAADETVLFNSSSGGAFPIFAAEIFKKGGVVVGAAWKDDLSVEHIMIDSENDLYKLQKSKYLQSYLGAIFRKVKEKLDNHIFVLFTGCPCQIAGLKAYLKRDYDNLLMIDLLCGNAPSTMFFQKYLADDFTEKPIKYEFRAKDITWDSIYVAVTSLDGQRKIRKGGKQDSYQRIYHNHTMCAPHCEKCKYQSVPRFGDLTIGDFWGIGKRDKTVDTKNGISAVLCNNEKGRRFFSAISAENFSVKKQVPLNWLGGNGYAINGYHNYCSPKRNDFYEAIKTMSFLKAIEYAVKPNHGLREKQGVFNFSSKATHFSFNPAIWSEDYINGTVVLTTKEVHPELGNYAVLPIYTPIKAGERYVLKARFKIATDSPTFSFHIKSAGEKIFQIIYTHYVELSNSRKWVEILKDFVADSDIYDEFMIGAAQLCGEERYIVLDYISIDET